jgi:hypothetical protein
MLQEISLSEDEEEIAEKLDELADRIEHYITRKEARLLPKAGKVIVSQHWAELKAKLQLTDSTPHVA